MNGLNWNSRNLTHGWQRGVTAFYYGLGFTPEDFDRPQVGIGVPLLEGNLCNMHAYRLGQEIVEGCRSAGLMGFTFGTPGVSDNITQGQQGGNASLPSRNVIANCAEMVVGAHSYDAMVGLHCCDKNGPGFAMALARLNYPGLIVSGGSIAPGCHKGRDTSILDVYDSQAAAAVGAMSQDEAEEILRTACPGPGGCGIAASFNTWGIACEALGIMLPYSSSIPAVGQGKLDECRDVGKALRLLLERNLRPRDILTREAFANATAVIAAAGGSTNGILHLLALAREAEVDFTLKDMQPILRETPVFCSFAPRGRKTMYDLHHLGGTPLLLKFLWQAGILKGDCLTVTGQTHAENLSDVPDVDALEAKPTDQPNSDALIAPLGKPFKPHADMQICFGNLAPDGMVFKVSSMRDTSFRGTALCFDDVRAVVAAVEQKRIQPGHIIVLRYLGPVASGMPEVLVATAALSTPDLDGKVAFLSDTRVSGVAHGAIGVHCAPEAAVGGPIAFVDDGDAISFDLMAGTLTLHVDEGVLAARRQQWRPPSLAHGRGYLADFAATVTQANAGCVSRTYGDRSSEMC
ncbi:MAG: dihydroxy-acid dehydratase [Planctomycetaceae bacterium]|nr:dihydroxy-acid dehydratase [Planctomycetaceae bacterium]